MHAASHLPGTLRIIPRPHLSFKLGPFVLWAYRNLENQRLGIDDCLEIEGQPGVQALCSHRLRIGMGPVEAAAGRRAETRSVIRIRIQLDVAGEQ